MNTYDSNDLDRVIEKIKDLQLDEFYGRFLLISARELLKLESYAEKNLAPLNETYMKHFLNIAKVTKDIGSELRAYQKDRLELNDEQLYQILRGIASQKPELLKMLLQNPEGESSGDT